MATFEPDSFITAAVQPSPNLDERAGNRPPDMILLHYTGMPTGEAALARRKRDETIRKNAAVHAAE